MVLADWTLSWNNLGGGTGFNPTLDAAIKYAGNSSLKCYTNEFNAGGYSRATHITFSETRAQLIVWARSETKSNAMPYVGHASYGILECTNSADATWERFKVSFWYDASSLTRWGRVERWNGAAWVQIGTDTNFGAGAPAAGAIFIESYKLLTQFVYTSNWFDELEVYS